MRLCLESTIFSTFDLTSILVAIARFRLCESDGGLHGYDWHRLTLHFFPQQLVSGREISY